MRDPASSGWYGRIVEEKWVSGEHGSDSLVVEPAPRCKSSVTRRGRRRGGVPPVRRQTRNEDGCGAALVVLRT
jgi:hypothetical protein